MSRIQRQWTGRLLSLWVIFSTYFCTAEAFEVETHFVINEAAVLRSSLGNYLAGELGLPDGVKTRLDGSTRVQEWVSLGGRWEDNDLRFLRHFHDPLRAWSKAGLGGIATASVIWGQDPESNDWSWPRARDYFYDGLTRASPGERERALAKTFRSLGQVMHLIVDLAVPAHTRNDAHPFSYTLESWLPAVSALEPGRFAEFLRATIGPDPDILFLEPDRDVPIPIARLWDTERFNGRNPEVAAGTGVGLAEYTNANFLSEDTRFTGYLFPNRESVRPEDFTIPDPRETSGTATRQYHVKWQHGDVGYRLATVGFLRDYYSRYLPDRLGDVSGGLDDHVYSDYSRRLLPRAIGYAKALLEYFLRGLLQASFSPGPNGGRELILKTRKLGSEPIGPGTLLLLYDDSEGVRQRIQEQPVPALEGASDLPDIRFDIPEGTPSQYVVVYRGQLGLEADAVVARVFGGLPIVAVQEVAALTGEEIQSEGGLQQGRHKNPNHQRAAGSFWAGGSAGVGKKIREVRVEEGRGHHGLLPAKAALRLNGKDVGPHWRAADDPGLLPERWEVVLAPIPGETSELTVVPPPALWVNDFRTPLLWIESARAGLDQRSLPDLTPDGLRRWITERGQQTSFHFGDGFQGLDQFNVIPLTTPRTRVSFRPVGEVAGLAVPRADFEFLPGECSLFRKQFLFAWRRVTGPFEIPRCEIGSDVFWAKNSIIISERVLTVAEPPDWPVPPLLTAATFRREFLEADLQRFLGLGILPPEYAIRTE